MNRDQARTLIENTFTSAFDKTKFRTFVVNVLNRIDETKAQAWNTTYIKDAFKPHVSRFERLGTYTSPDNATLDVLVVHLTNESKLERARTLIRNFVADHLKQRDEKDAALVAFVSPTEQQWRFSYVKMEYTTVQKESGKVGVEQRLTPARRFSYLVGEGESSHTAQSRFLGLLQDTQTDPSLAQLEEAFSVEAVTKEFFKKYAELFEQVEKALSKIVSKDKTVAGEFSAKKISAVDFAKKLLGQIVFLYFIQKKGWLGVEKAKEWGTGPHDFLRRLAMGQYGKFENFFNDILEPLFYDTLATDRGHDAWDKRFKCRIPFLNGGLFEPLSDYNWKKIDIELPNKLFTNSEFVEEGIIGTGILDVFDRYNFTVNEAEPLEKEVAIDPEMLGKVFENLIEENRRKGLGSYYTPREIVHYMCQESLINYLDTSVNQANQQLSRDDIETFVHLGEQISHYEAVETEYRVKMPKSIEKNAKQIDEKLADITVCDPAVGSGAFPVGMMSEIVRARTALTAYFNDPHERSPYFFKRHAIQNCIYGVDIDSSAVEIAKLRLWLSLVVDEENVKVIKPLPNLDYKVVVGNSLLGLPFKSERLRKIEELKQKLFDETDLLKKSELKDQVSEQLARVFATSQKTLGFEVSFDFQVLFSEVFQTKSGFDIVIGNPPYGLIGKDGFEKIYGPRFPLLSGKPDLYRVFIERSLSLPNSKGVISFIVPNTLLAIPSALRLRQSISHNKTILKLIDLTLPVFDQASVNNIIFLIGMGKPNANKVEIGVVGQGQTINFLLKLEKVQQLKWASDPKCIWSIHAHGGAEEVLSKIELGAITLENLFQEIVLGMQVYHNSIHSQSQMKTRYLHSDTKKDVGWLPEFSGRDIKNLKIVKRDNVEFVNYSAAKIYHKPDLKFLNGPRVILREILGDRLVLAYAEASFVVSKSCYILRSATKDETNTKALLAILSSKCISFWVHLRGDKSKQALFPRITMNTLKSIPISKNWEGIKDHLVQEVNSMLATRSNDVSSGLQVSIERIDRLVYKMYSLSEDEIKIVEDSTRRGGEMKSTEVTPSM